MPKRSFELNELDNIMWVYKARRSIFLLILVLTVNGSAYGKSIPNIKQWKQFIVSYRNNSWDGNPFDLHFKGEFTSPSGKVLTQFGFYAGDNTWKIYFMPNELGKWTFKTASPDADLDGRSGSFNCVKSNLKGELVSYRNRWKFVGDGGAFPVIWNPVVPDGVQWDFRSRKASDAGVQQALHMAADTVGATLLGFGELVIRPVGWASAWPQSAVPYTIGKEGKKFNLSFWNRLNAKLDRARDQGMGAYVMLYSDDEQAPDHFGITPKSKEELRLFRYVVARLASYPNIVWDSGIDIGEYRSKRWIDWYAKWFRKHDPWQHPVGSRTGGGSGGSTPSAGTYYSLGDASLPSRDDLLEDLVQTSFFGLISSKRPVPIAHTDHWRPFIRRGHWTNDKVRTAVWRCALSDFQALYADYQAGYEQGKYEQMKQGAKYIGYATYFFDHLVRSDLRDIRPHDELLKGSGDAIVAANPGREYILYLERGGPALLDLSGPIQVFNVFWYNPRTGEKQQAKTVRSGEIVRFLSPTSGKNHDWVLLLQNKRWVKNLKTDVPAANSQQGDHHYG